MINFEMTWDAPEFHHHERGVSWYWISILISAGMIAFAVWQRNFLFGFFILMAEVLSIIWGSRTPRIISFFLSEKELVVNQLKHYPISKFESFSVNQLDEMSSEIFLQPKGKLETTVMVIIPSERLEEATANLKLVLRQIEYQATIVDSLEKIIGF